MNSGKASLTRNRPLRGTRREAWDGARHRARHWRSGGGGGILGRPDFCVQVHRKLPAHAEILLTSKPQSIGERSVAPSQMEFRWLESRRGARNRAAQANCADILQFYARAHGP